MVCFARRDSCGQEIDGSDEKITIVNERGRIVFGRSSRYTVALIIELFKKVSPAKQQWHVMPIRGQTELMASRWTPISRKLCRELERRTCDKNVPLIDWI
jgi:hypothetical protein